MTVNVARRTRRRATTPKTPIVESAELTYAPAPTFAIGEIGQTVFDCPSCSRPLALGARRCPGCRTRLLNGVVLTKASTFVALGLAVGLVSGGAAGVFFGLSQHAAAAPALVTPVASPAPAGGVTSSVAPASTPTATRTLPPAGNGVPPVARAALGQVLDMNSRLGAARDDLRALVGAKVLDTSAVAQTLRTISADSMFGEQLATRVSVWSDGGAVGSELAAFFGTIHDTAARGLDASVRNEGAYRATALLMIKLLDGSEAVDASVRSAAAAAGLTLAEPSTAP
jgi:hypothetical protein